MVWQVGDWEGERNWVWGGGTMRKRGSEISDKEGREEDTEVCWEWRRRGLLGDRRIREKGRGR